MFWVVMVYLAYVVVATLLTFIGNCFIAAVFNIVMGGGLFVFVMLCAFFSQRAETAKQAKADPSTDSSTHHI